VDGAFGQAFAGRIDEVRIYNRALTQAEVQQDMTTPIGGAPPDTTPPTAPTNLTATAVSSSQINLSWTASTDNVGVTGYQVERCQGTGCSTFALVASPAGTAYSDPGLQPATSYSYRVLATDAAGNISPPSSTASATTSAQPTLAITAPQGGATITGTTVNVSYTTSGDMTGVDHVHFQLDSNPEVMDLSLDGVYQFTAIPVGSHVLTGYLVRADHSKILGSDAAPVSFTTIADPSDPIPPTVSITAPANGATVSGTITVSADATDNVAVAGVRFQLDGANIGTQDKIAPYSVSLDTATLTNGPHSLTAVALDAAGNQTTASPITVTVSNVSPTDPSRIGQWSGPFTWPLVAVHLTLLPTGKVLAWDDHTDNQGAQIFDPATNTLTPVPFNSANLFCAGHCLLPDGRVFVAGGHLGAHIGIPDATVFDPVTQAWTSLPPMAFGRWYPTVTALPDGRLLVTAGETTCDDCNAQIPEIYDPTTNSWAQLSGAALDLPYYPHMFVLPDGRMIVASTNKRPIPTSVLDLPTQTWSTVDPVPVDGGSSAMYQPGKIIKSGMARDPDLPGAPSVATTYVLDMTQASPAWRQTPAMAFPRTEHNLTLLPDGTVLTIGGATNSNVYDLSAAVLEAELWSPATETWTTMARMQTPRMYHSTALLLPDGRVLAAGSGRYGVDQLSAEIYSPPYLFKGPRPTITSVPAGVQHATDFFVATPDASRIASVSLIRLGSVTHAFNQNQRFLTLTFQQSGGGLTVQAPSNPNLAPPGHYLLFLVDTNGIPSVASFVRLPTPSEDAQPPTPPSNLSAAVSIGSVSLSWSPATDNLGVTGYNVHRSTTSGVIPTSGNLIGQTSLTSYTDTGFAAGTYYYVVTARDAAGNTSVPSNEVSATVMADTTPPTAPTNLTATAANSTQINLAWTASTDNVGVTGYRVERCQGPGCSTFTQVASSPGTTYNDTGLLPATNYTFRVRATDATGNLGPYSNTASATTTAQPSGLVAAYALDEGAGSTLADASGNGNTGALSGATWTSQGKYGSALAFNGANQYVTVPNSPSLDIAGTRLTLALWVNITDTGVDSVVLAKPWAPSSMPAPYYQYAIEFDGNGAKTLDFYFGDTTATLQGPFSVAPPLGIWTHVAFTYDGATVRGYVDGIQRLAAPATQSIQARGNSLRIGVDGAFGQAFAGRIDEVRIYNRALTQAEIQQDMTTPIGGAPPDTTPPTAPTNLTATAASSTQINLGWTASTDNVGVTGYQVERCQGAGCASFALVASPAGTAYSDLGLQPATSYSYRVRARDAAGNFSLYSTTASATTPAPPDTTPPTAPTNLTATAASSTQINLAWTASTDNVGVTGYQVERCQGTGCSTFALVASPAGTAYSDPGLQPATSYSYRVRATDAAGNLSGYSNTASATTPAQSSGLVAAYSFNEGAGSTVADASGNGNTGTILYATWTTQGKFGKALVFNGTDAWVTVNDSASLHLSSGMTIEAWVYPTVRPSGWRTIVHKEVDIYYLMASSSQNTPAGGGTFTAGNQNVYAPSSLKVNTWTHIAVTYDGAALRLYVNGQEVANQPQITPLMISTQPLRIGGNSPHGEYFRGRIDEVRIYNRALTQAEIQQDMSTPISSP
jgi:fibronectin type 3 domain-containing protein